MISVGLLVLEVVVASVEVVEVVGGVDEVVSAVEVLLALVVLVVLLVLLVLLVVLVLLTLVGVSEDVVEVESVVVVGASELEVEVMLVVGCSSGVDLAAAAAWDADMAVARLAVTIADVQRVVVGDKRSRPLESRWDNWIRHFRTPRVRGGGDGSMSID